MPQPFCSLKQHLLESTLATTKEDMKVQFPDWQSLEERLFEQTSSVIRQFATEHSDVTCSFFAYDTDPGYGYFLPSFDTAENSLLQAQKNEQRAIEERAKMLSQE